MTELRLPLVERVEWHEGMILSPQHFQQLSARLDTLVGWQTLAASPFSWGVRRIVIDPGMLPGGALRIVALDAVLPDGTAIDYDSANPLHAPLEIALQSHAEQLDKQALDIYLTLPVAQTMRHKGAIRRFRSVPGPLIEDQVSEAPPVDLSLQLPNLALHAGSVPSVHYTRLRLGAAVRENDIFLLDHTLPPLLEISAEHTPGNRLWQRVAALVAQLRAKAAFIAKQTANPSSRIDERLTQLEWKDRLRSLLTELPQLEAVLRTPHLHPLALYYALSRMLGSLSLLKPGAVPPAPPPYDHADPLKVFAPLLDWLDATIEEVSQQYREQKFELQAGAFSLGLTTAALPARLYIGLRGQSDKDLDTWIGGAVIGAAGLYPSLRARRVLGAARHRVDEVVDFGVRAGSGYLLYALDTARGDILPGEALVISHPNEGATAQRPHEIVLFSRD
ncbi:type VI secretion system baseplate subunit TssK [Robbsia andropogonis]|uniref:type VI secretion system baseplate subunit TssK n=1 Tax=Robbsia andropogonis TaxID=28092 RepID=UPI000467648C|nr:type VI secretion system baseplate subunit TssK [Robbsia andropogonis]MCP1118034.1 type VI secretion system baseplate subunit TssK [Robbsia andropogonis]MCP1127685.1 type VI secretion system baseplate subunit TssK [Robbsia andropogonis]